jgi:hypothetical protein
MRLTIIPADGAVSVNGRGFGGIDMLSIDPTIHAVQWYGTQGEIEYATDKDGVKPANLVIDSLADFQAVLDAWEQKRAAEDAPPAPKSLADHKVDKIRQINGEAQKFVDQMTAGYPDFEIQTWPDQKAEALAWHADNTAATPVIDRMAERRKIDRIDYLQRTYAKVIAFQAVYDVVGDRQYYVDQVNAIVVNETTTEAQAIDQVNAIVPVFPVPDPVAG